MTTPAPAVEPVRCVLCNTPITAARSIRRRMGRDCWRKTRPAAAPTPGRGDAPRPRRQGARAGPAQGQLALAIPEPLPEPRTPHHPPVWRGRRVQTIPTGGLL